jgi:hypothetical protein
LNRAAVGLQVFFDLESVVGNMEVGIPRGMASTIRHSFVTFLTDQNVDKIIVSIYQLKVLVTSKDNKMIGVGREDNYGIEVS